LPKVSARHRHANLTVERKAAPTAKINEPVLGAVLSTLKSLSGKSEALRREPRWHSVA
jgi:hypothetical protein